MNPLKINEDIPGTFSANQLRYVAKLASEVPRHGWIVELGSLNGRASYALGANKQDSVMLTCIDKFRVHSRDDVRGDKRTNEMSYKQWNKNTKSLVNVNSVQLMWPIECEYLSPNRGADLVLFGARHSYEETLEDLFYWFDHLKIGGSVVVSSYGGKHPGVKQAIDEFVEKMPVKEINTNICLGHIVKE